MTQIVIGWDSKHPLAAARIESFVDKVAQRYQVLFKDRLETQILSGEHRGLACIGIDLNTRQIYKNSNQLVCLRGDPSITTPTASDTGSLDAEQLFRLVRTAHGANNSSQLINPPWTLFWYDVLEDEVGCVNDGVGLSKVFTAAHGGVTCFSNKCWPITQLLQRQFSPDNGAWGHWFSQGWFPGIATAFNDIKLIGPSEHRTYRQNGTTLKKIDTASIWLDAKLESDDLSLLEAATLSFSSIVGLGAEQSYSADLTGGLDSRAVCAAIINQSKKCKFTTFGHRFSDDVIIAGKIAKQFNLSWSCIDELDSGLISNSAIDDTLVKFEKMALWDEGNVEPNRFEHLPAEPVGQNPSINLNGATSEISRAYYYSYSLKHKTDSLAAAVISKLRKNFHSEASQILLDSGDVECFVDEGFSTGKQYQLSGLDLVDYYYLNERIRRWYGAHLDFSLAGTKRTPFMTVDHIKLAFALSPHAKASSIYQYYLVRSLCPELMSVPINQQINLSRIWRWRKLSVFSRLMQPNSGYSRIADVAQYFLDNELSNDSPIFEIVKSNVIAERFSEFISTKTKNYYFVLRVMAFEAWRKQFCL